MRVHIEGDLYLTGDKMGYSIVKKSVTKTGENAGNDLFVPLGIMYISPLALRKL